MIDRYIAEHLPKLAKNNAGDQTSMLKKMVEPAWGNKLVTEITKCQRRSKNRPCGGAKVYQLRRPLAEVLNGFRAPAAALSR
jgi:hypothetical protein